MDAKELIKLLVYFSKADNEFKGEEFAFILNVATKLGITQDQVEHIVRNPGSFELEAPDSEQSRMQIMYYLLFLMKIDKSVDEDEAALVHHFGFRLGFSRGMINDFIDLMKHHQDSRVPSSGMLDIIRRYQN